MLALILLWKSKYEDGIKVLHFTSLCKFVQNSLGLGQTHGHTEGMIP